MCMAEKGGGDSKVITCSKPTLDVLRKNNFGRSALTEGFSSGNTKTVEHLLNHDSAEEEKLIGGLDKKEVEDKKEANAVVEGSKQSSDKNAAEKKALCTSLTS